MRFGMDGAVRATGAAGLRAGPQGLVDNGLDGTRAAATFGTATEAAIDLLGIAGEVFRAIDRTADIVVGQHIAGTNDHENVRALPGSLVTRYLIRYSRPWQDAKGKTAFSSDSKLAGCSLEWV